MACLVDVNNPECRLRVKGPVLNFNEVVRLADVVILVTEAYETYLHNKGITDAEVTFVDTTYKPRFRSYGILVRSNTWSGLAFEVVDGDEDSDCYILSPYENGKQEFFSAGSTPKVDIEGMFSDYVRKDLSEVLCSPRNQRVYEKFYETRERLIEIGCPFELRRVHDVLGERLSEQDKKVDIARAMYVNTIGLYGLSDTGIMNVKAESLFSYCKSQGIKLNDFLNPEQINELTRANNQSSINRTAANINDWYYRFTKDDGFHITAKGKKEPISDREIFGRMIKIKGGSAEVRAKLEDEVVRWYEQNYVGIRDRVKKEVLLELDGMKDMERNRLPHYGAISITSERILSVLPHVTDDVGENRRLQSQLRRTTRARVEDIVTRHLEYYESVDEKLDKGLFYSDAEHDIAFIEAYIDGVKVLTERQRIAIRKKLKMRERIALARSKL